MKKLLTTLALSLGILATVNAQYTNDFIKIGQKAPELSAADPNGKALKLSEINKGNYVIIDFWASWCGPCRHANPGLVRMYNEYSKKKFTGAQKGFTVLSYSLDMNKNAWTGAIAADHLSWPNHMADLPSSQWGSVVTRTYGIQYIPQAFLVSPEGKVLAKGSSAEDLESELKKYVKQ